MPLKLMAALILILCAFLGIGEANQNALLSFDLSLAGYRLGLSYDDVAKIRPFHYEQSAIQNPDGSQNFCAVVEQVYVDDVSMSLQVSFRNDKVHKIVSRIPTDSFDNVLQSFQQTLGSAEDMSKVVNNYNGKANQQEIYLWDYPSAEMYLVKISSNNEYATIALMAKQKVM